MSTLNNKIALVTGASRGIGRATALTLAREGAHVLAHYSQSVHALIDATRATLAGRKLDVLVNNAGVADWAPWTEITEAQFDRQLAVNVKAVFFLTRGLLEVLADDGRIVNVSSVVASTAFPELMPYSATKGALDVLTFNLAQALGSRGITVNAISPGATRTDMSAWLNDPAGAAGATSNQALKRVGEAEDIAEAIALIASPGARWITGQIIDASGGWKL
jgi:3-oxoacyl-[acyl-carrier protein] reductase